MLAPVLLELKFVRAPFLVSLGFERLLLSFLALAAFHAGEVECDRQDKARDAYDDFSQSKISSRICLTFAAHRRPLTALDTRPSGAAAG